MTIKLIPGQGDLLGVHVDSRGIVLGNIILSESAGGASDSNVVVAVTTLFPRAACTDA